MSRSNSLNLILLIVVITLAVVIYNSEEASTRLDRLTDIDINSIDSIVVTHNKNETEIIRRDGHWQITRPLSIDANSFRINSILKLVNAPVHNRYSLSEIDSRVLGLEQPTTTIRMNTKLFSFGITNPATNLRYIQSDGAVFTIEDVYYPLLSSHFGTLVSLNLLPENSSIVKLVLLNQTISRDTGGRWHSDSDISADNINRTLDHWQSSQAFGIHEYLRREQLGEVSVYLAGNPEPVTFVITDTSPWLILARPELGIEYHLDIEAYDNLIEPR